MKLVIPTAHTKKMEIPISADVKKAFTTYYKNAKIVDADNESVDIEILMLSYLATFGESEEFAEMAKEAEEVKAEREEAKAKAKAEREAKKAQREAERAQKNAEKIAKLQAEIDKLKIED